MDKKILILNGSPHENGHTAKLAKSFKEGAESAGNQVTVFHLDSMNIHGCKGCLKASKNTSSPCAQKDDMDKIYPKFNDANVVVFASPVYFWTITGQLKSVADRLYAMLECLGHERFAKECVLLMTADGRGFDVALTWYNNYEKNLGWKNIGAVLGGEKIEDAYKLGLSI